MRDGISEDTDKVITDYPIPHDGRLNNIWGEVHLLGAMQDYRKYSAYGCHGYWIPIEDSHGTYQLDALWDDLVPKANELTYAADTQMIQYDTGSANTGSAWQPGEGQLEEMFDAGPAPELLFERREWLSLAKNKPLGWIDESGTSADTWIPNDYFRVRTGRRLRAATLPAYVLFAVGQPNTAETSSSTGNKSTLGSTTLIASKFITEFIKFAFAQQLGWTANSQDISDGATTLIDYFVTDDVREETGSTWHPATFQVLAPFTFDISVPGVFRATNPLTSG